VDGARTLASLSRLFGLILGFGVALAGGMASGALWSKLFLLGKQDNTPAVVSLLIQLVFVIFLAGLCRRRWGAKRSGERPGAEAAYRYSLRQLLALVLAAGPAMALWTAQETVRVAEDADTRGYLALAFSLVIAGWELGAYFRRSDPEQNPAFFLGICIISLSTAALARGMILGLAA